MEFNNDNFRATVDGDGWLAIHAVNHTNPVAVLVVSTPLGVRAVSTTEIVPPVRHPILSANYAGDDEYNVDVDCGAQRFNGIWCDEVMREQLSSIGLDPDEILPLVRGHEYDLVPMHH